MNKFITSAVKREVQEMQTTPARLFLGDPTLDLG